MIRADHPPTPLDYRTPTATLRLPPTWRTGSAVAVLACAAVPPLDLAAMFVAAVVVRHRHGPWFYRSGSSISLRPVEFVFVACMDANVAVGLITVAIGSAAVMTFVVNRWPRSARPWPEVAAPAAVGAGLLVASVAGAVAVGASVLR